MNKPFEYDDTSIARVYVKGRSLPEASLRLWLDAIAEHTERSISAILDLGCGTGRFSEALAERFDADVVGLDPSESMLRETESTSASRRVSFIVGRADSIPLEAASVSMVFMSMAYHHLTDPAEAISEMERVLQPGGYVAIRTATREDIGQAPLFEYFPTARVLEQARMPTEEGLIETLTSGGFELFACQAIEQLFATDWTEYHEKVSQRALSVLNLIEDEEFNAGLKELGKPIPKTHDPVFERFHLFVFQRRQDPEGTTLEMSS